MSELKQIEVEGVVYDVRDAGAVRKAQGADNAGKLLGIGTDGNVGPVNGVAIDDVPTEGSENAVSSGGVWSALQESGSSAVTSYTVTVPVSGWTASGAFKINTVTVSGLKETYPQRPRIDCDVTNTDAESDAAMMAAFALLTGAETGTNSLTLYVAGGLAPDINLSIYLEVAE